MPKGEAITFKQLRALRAVAKFGSITAAADALRLTPPAVHTQLKTLEANFRCKLINRSGTRGATPTVEGLAILDAEATMQTAISVCIEKVRALREGKSGVVVLGVVSTGKYFAPGLVAKLAEAFPNVEVILRIGNRDTIITALQQRTIDLAIMGRPPRAPTVIAQPIGTHPHVIIAAADHPLAGKDTVSAKELLAETFIAREDGSGTRILMVRYLDRIGDGAPFRFIEMGTNETIKQAVIAKLGIALISQHTVTDELNSGRLVTLKGAGLPIDRIWYLLHREDLEMTPTLTRVHDLIAGLGKSFLPSLKSEG